MNANRCALNRIECALSVQCERAFSERMTKEKSGLFCVLDKVCISERMTKEKCGLFCVLDKVCGASFEVSMEYMSGSLRTTPDY